MKTRWWNWLLIALFVPTFFLIPVLRNIEKLPSPSPKPEATPVCFLTGDIKNTLKPATQGITAVGNMIRLYLDADTLAGCKLQAEAYCKTQVAPHPELIPSLRVFFRKNSEETGFVLKDACVFSELRREQEED